MNKATKQASITLDQTRIKWVKRANMWCRAEIKNGEQKITWHSTKEEAQSCNTPTGKS